MKEKKEAHPFDKLGKPAQRALANVGIKTLEQLAQLTETEFMKLHGIGKKSLPTLVEDLQKAGLSFKQK